MQIVGMPIGMDSLGLALGAIGAVIMLIPALERVGQRLYGYFSTTVRYVNPWDMAIQDPNYHRRNDVCTMIGLAFLLIGFLFQFFGNK